MLSLASPLLYPFSRHAATSRPACAMAARHVTARLTGSVSLARDGRRARASLGPRPALQPRPPPAAQAGLQPHPRPLPAAAAAQAPRDLSLLTAGSPRSSALARRGSLARAGLGPRLAAQAASSSPHDLFLLDLDGVLVDSVGELAGSAHTAAVARWPEVMASSPFSRDEVLQGLAGGRPRIIAGFEALVMARLMAEVGPEDGVKAVLADWPGAMLASTLQRWGESPADLIPFFEAQRRAAAKDEVAWLAANHPYPGIVAALRDVCGPWYVVSSKSTPRVALLMKGLLGLDGFEEGSPRLIAGLQPPDSAKPAAIAALAARAWGLDREADLAGVGGAAPPQNTLHFVDDRYETLAAVATSPLLGPAVAARALRLHHAGWGYATSEEKAAARADSSVNVLDLESFLELLRWGHGCAPTAEEVEEGAK